MNRATRRCLVFLCAYVLFITACGGGSPSSPSQVPAAAAAPPALTVDIWSVTVNRWAQSGAYAYDVSYRLHSTYQQSFTAAVADFELLGPNGEVLGGTISPFTTLQETVGALSWTNYRTITIDDKDASHPFADRLRLTVGYPDSGGARIVEATSQVLHGPQTARLMEFSASPMELRLGDLVTVRWNVQDVTRRVTLSTAIAWDLNDPKGQRFEQDVEPVGSRTFTVRRTGVTGFDLDVDGSLIHRTITMVPRP